MSSNKSLPSADQIASTGLPAEGQPGSGAAGEFVLFLRDYAFGLGPPLGPPVQHGSVLTQSFANARLELSTDGRYGPFGQVRISDLGTILLAAGKTPFPPGGLLPDGESGALGLNAGGHAIARQFAEHWLTDGGHRRFGAPLGRGYSDAESFCQLFGKALLKQGVDGSTNAADLGRQFESLTADERMAVDLLPPADSLIDYASGIDAPIIYYHDVPDRTRFASQLRGLQEAGYTVVPYARLVRALRGAAALPPSPLVLTFDDGRLSQLQNAVPVLLEQRLPATFFVLPGFHLKQPGFMDSLAFEGLARSGFSVQSHTINHAALDTLLINDHGAAEAEAVHSRAALLDIGGGDHLSYPFGQYDQGVADLARAAGYCSAVSTRSGRIHRPEDLYRMARIQINPDGSPELALERLATAG